MRNSDEIEISIIIVSWNTRGLLKNCLKSIYETQSSLRFEIIVIDNFSHDESLEMVQNDFSSVLLIKNRVNLGFATACNQGIAKAKGKYLLLLNPDTIVLKDSIAPAIKELENDPKIAVLGAKILNPDLSYQPSCRRFPELSSQILILFKLHHVFPQLSSIKKYFMSDWLHNEKREVDQVMGAYFLTKREIIENAGVLDEKYKLYFEEVDFCRRVKNMGYKVVFFPDSKIIHYQGESFKQIRGLKSQMVYNKSLWRYFKKYGHGSDQIILALIFPFSIALAFVVQVLLSLKLLSPKP